MSEEIIQYRDVTPVQKLDAALNLIADIEDGSIYKSSVMLVETIQLAELEMVFNKLIKE